MFTACFFICCKKLIHKWFLSLIWPKIGKRYVIYWFCRALYKYVVDIYDPDARIKVPHFFPAGIFPFSVFSVWILWVASLISAALLTACPSAHMANAKRENSTQKDAFILQANRKIVRWLVQRTARTRHFYGLWSSSGALHDHQRLLYLLIDSLLPCWPCRR